MVRHRLQVHLQLLQTKSVLAKEFPPPVCLHKTRFSCKIILQKNKFINWKMLFREEHRTQRANNWKASCLEWTMITKQTLVQSTLHYSKSRIPPDSNPQFWGSSIKLGQIKRAMVLALRFTQHLYLCECICCHPNAFRLHLVQCFTGSNCKAIEKF